MENVIIQDIKKEIEKIVVGKGDIIEKVIAAIIAGGHVLLEDVPGVGKTTLALAISRTLALDYRRVQFTPDVLPSDIVGFSMFNKKINDFEFKEGAAMCNLLLADEINRTSPKTQAALLEVMEESKVTVDGETHLLPDPFFVIATQNPMGYVGTQKLPESQLDRFLVRLSMGYPDASSEKKIYMGTNNSILDTVSQVVNVDDIKRMKKEANEVRIDEKLTDMIVNFVISTRVCEYTALGMSPRGGIALTKMAKSLAYMGGRNYVIPEDILNSIEAVSIHRVVLNSKAKANGIDEYAIIRELKSKIVIP